MSRNGESVGIRLLLLNIHGLLKGSGLEIGRDADNGGQTKYVFEVAEELSRHVGISKVDIVTRRIDDESLSEDYNLPIEIINDKLSIHRISFGGRKYRMKEQLWQYLDEFVAKTIQHIRAQDMIPDWIHSHYADAGYAAIEISKMLNIPFSHTGHSLGKAKKAKVEAMGLTTEEAEKRFRFLKRIDAEERILINSSYIITSTNQEIESYKAYEHFADASFKTIAPGIDTDKFAPYYQTQMNLEPVEEEELQRKYWVGDYIEKFLVQPHKPVILALSRPDRRKNLHTLLDVYGKDKGLQSLANLVIFAGIRKDIDQLPPADRDVLVEILLLMDKYDLYGKLAIPKKHDVDNEVATIYRYCAEKRGVFVNLTLYENFGLTIIEAASTGLPVVSTKNGGPSEILPKCKNGVLVDPENPIDIKNAIVEVLTDEVKWKEFSNEGILNIKKFYSWKRHADEYVALVQSELEKGKEGPVSLTALRFRNMDRLFASDIDGTLIFEEEGHPGLDELRQIINMRPEQLAFAMVSGRSKDFVRQAIEKYDLPNPDLIIAGVGSEIYYFRGNEYHKDKAWSKHLDWRWDRRSIVSQVKTIPWLEMQEDEGQNPHKISYYFDPEKYDAVLLKKMLTKYWPYVTLIASHDRFLDILPRRASKGKALKYICKKWAIPSNHVIVAGDSGNDLDMLEGSMKGVVVGNKAAELRHLKAQKNLYLAAGHAAAGILEGWRHFGWL